MRKDLCADALVSSLRLKFDEIKDIRKTRSISLADILMSGYAVFSLKYPSLLSFDKQFRGTAPDSENMKSLFGIGTIPSDTCMRETIDELDPDAFRPAFKELFARLQRGKEVEKFSFIDGKYLIAMDGTGLYSSNEVHCSCCMVKTSKEGLKTYYHQCFGVVMVHPDQKAVIPFFPEAILKQDGQTKNDCERNASRRALEKLRKDHPRLQAIVIEDGLASNAPHISTLRELGFSYILGAKPGDHQHLFEQVDLAGDETHFFSSMNAKGHKQDFKWVNNVELNEANPEIKVNFLEFFETNSKTGKTLKFTWVTDVLITEKNVEKIMKGARARWRIENETFNTLKNQGYNFEHNFGHGKKNLCTNFAILMFLAFAVEQIQLLSCKVFQQVREKLGTFRKYCESILAVFEFFSEIPDWEAVLTVLLTRRTVPLRILPS